LGLKPLIALGIVAFLNVSAAYSVELLPMFDKNTYSIGEWPVITVQDSAKNIQDDLAESITITILSDSDSDGKQLELTETGQNTGIFTSTIQLSSSPGIENTLYVQDGDSIHAMYLSFIKTAKIKSDFNLSPILVSTDKADYKIGEIIVISGSVSGGNTSYDVNLSIVDPHGNSIYTEVIDLSYIQSFSTEINTEITGWNDSGNYKILIWHESEDKLAETVFSFSSTYGKQETTDTIKIFNSPINLDYTITSGKITLVRADLAKNSLFFSIDVGSGGQLTVEIPRYVMDAQDEDGDTDYTVLMDYRNAAFVEKKNPNERTLTIPYIHNTKNIEIVGTFLDLDPSSPTESTIIPEWVRNNAEWWSKDLIGEGDFLSGIEYLIVQGVIQIPIIPADNGTESSAFVPSWIKDTAGWWSEGLVSDLEFVNGLQYLISQEIITV
jgi:hypothetical protein